MSNPCKPIDMEWERLTLIAKTLKTVQVNGKTKQLYEKKVILNDLSGSIKHGKFTAILGPSGCGKTTLLNFLAGRTDSKINITGDFRVNSKSVFDISSISNIVAFVQQDDILLPTMTPREIFTFAANLRLKLSKEKKAQRVEQIIQELDIEKCANTRVGNAEMRGLSGGERKRASIGVDLITNPSLIFLDEPTTGLDSTTALNVLQVLQKLARNGRNIVSTIHQPSTEIFNTFDNLLLMVRGNIIYQGLASDAVRYFGSIGRPCPKQMNPADFFMKLMNESGLVVDDMKASKTTRININPEEIEERMQKNIADLVQNYRQSPMVEEIKKDISTEVVKSKSAYQVSWFYQFYLILIRAFRNELRNPMNFKTTFIQTIFVVFLVNSLYYNLAEDKGNGVQNRLGVLFMLASMSGFTSVTGSLGTFSQEKPVFLRERLTKSYSAGAYFWAKAVSELPFLMLYPLLLILPIYWFIGLNTLDNKFLIMLVFHIMCWLAGSGYGLFLSTIISRLEFALALVPALLVPLVVLTGFFVSQDNIPWYFGPFEYISLFKWVFQGTAQNEFDQLDLACGTHCLDKLEFQQKDWQTSMLALALIAIGTRVLAYIGIVAISLPKKSNMSRPVGENPYERPTLAPSEILTDGEESEGRRSDVSMQMIL